MSSRRLGFALAAFAAVALGAAAAPGVAAARAPIRPVAGDWEGQGPHGLRLSFAFVRHGRRLAPSDFALGLPTGCSPTAFESWEAGTEPRIEYLAPGSALHGPFAPLGPRQFEFILPPTASQPTPVIMGGSFSSRRRGVVSIESPSDVGCPHPGWPRTLRFALAAARRVHVADGVWSGPVTAPPPGISGTVKVRVIDGGRIETDFATTFTCPAGGTGDYELGPLATVGLLIGADGTVGGAPGTESTWTGSFSPAGVLSGSFATGACGSALQPHFTAQLAAPA